MVEKKNINGNYENSLNVWANQEMIANEFISVLSKLFYNKSIELVLFRSQLIDRSASLILYRHSYAENIINRQLKIEDSLELAKAILHCNIIPSKLDIGKLSGEWIAEKDNYVDAEDFIKIKLKNYIEDKPKFKPPVDVVLYGFGRIGRLLARELIIQGNGHQLRVRAIVTRSNSEEQIVKRASLLRHDSVHGPFRGIAIENLKNKTIYINGHEVLMLAANNPEDIDYTEYGINNAVLIDNTGIYRDREGLGRHLKAKGISKVVLTAPGKGDIPNIVFGVNDKTVDYKKETIFSAASCTTNAAAPVLAVIEKEFGIKQGHLETVHSYTNDQNLLDNMHKKTRRGRSAPLNLVITETGAAKAVTKIIPSLVGKITGNAIRVPTPNVSLVILKLTLNRETSIEEINELMRQTSLSGELVAQVKYSTSADAVSSDFISEPATLVYDSNATIVSSDKKNIVVYVWYDNEFGYALQVIRVAKNMAGVKRPTYY
ncbi:MAG: glyceraldehyde-3-phosphate dehydrogenase [Bacteroidetes bacterium]|nr:glyceraldehyde-3-phosphate dehydrogenase [Bacteroidota bacterium]MBL6944215.1 glyceraldehyde-3-phosphate dehydrogenase [Bacteroidales bacterium]